MTGNKDDDDGPQPKLDSEFTPSGIFSLFGPFTASTARLGLWVIQLPCPGCSPSKGPGWSASASASPKRFSFGFSCGARVDYLSRSAGAHPIHLHAPAARAPTGEASSRSDPLISGSSAPHTGSCTRSTARGYLMKENARKRQRRSPRTSIRERWTTLIS